MSNQTSTSRGSTVTPGLASERYASDASHRQRIRHQYEMMARQARGRERREARVGVSQGRFMNFGLWSPQIRSARDACENLMHTLLGNVERGRGRVLDVACGRGATTAFLCRSWPADRVTAIDLTQGCLRLCALEAPGAARVSMDATQLGFADGSFEAVVCIEAGMHFTSRAAFLREAHRVLAPGGRLLMTDLLVALEPSYPGDGPVTTPQDYQGLVLDSGFAKVEVRDITSDGLHAYARFQIAAIHEAWLGSRMRLAELHEMLKFVYWAVDRIRFNIMCMAEK